MSKLSVFIRSPHNYDTDEESFGAGFTSDLPSRTQQQFREECDINTIVRRFGITGEMPEALSPKYGDFSYAVDFHSAMNAVRSASEGFMTLPGELRERFRNDPGELIAFLGDSRNRDEAVSLGLVPKPAVVAPDPAPVPVTPPPEA